MTDIKPFLEPISPDSPCGRDVSYDPAFLTLETLAKGKEETQFAPAEDPNWREVQTATLELLRQSKHLRLGILITLSLMKNEGLPGVRNGLLLLKTWIEKYWDTLFPLLDPEDHNDPIQRVNLLQTLSSKAATEDKFLDRLSEAPLAESPRLGKYNLKTVSGTANKQEISAAFADTNAEQLRARYDAAVESVALIKEMDALLAEKIGGGRAPSFADLTAALKQITALMAPHCGGVVEAPQADAAAAGGTTGQAGGGGGLSLGAIGSRADVVRALQAICAYYRTSEPGSPIPLLLERAQRLVDKNFMQIVDDLAPGAVPQFDVLGVKRQETPPQ